MFVFDLIRQPHTTAKVLLSDVLHDHHSVLDALGEGRRLRWWGRTVLRFKGSCRVLVWQLAS